MRNKTVDEVEFRRLHALGLDRQGIADGVGIRKDSVRKVCLRLGLEPPQPPPPKYDILATIDADEFRKLAASGMYTRDLAGRYQVSPSAILDWCRRLDVPLPALPPANQTGGQRQVYNRELFRELDAAGLSGPQIAERLGCSARQVDRIRGALGLRRGRPHFKYPQSVRNEALKMLDDGASYNEVARTLDIHEKTVRQWFPGRGWTHSQAVEYRHMLSKLEDVSAVNGHGESRSGWRKTGAY